MRRRGNDKSCSAYSIRPEWCDKIISGEKTIEIRKTRPKMETPFKCYVYETHGDTLCGNQDFRFLKRGNGIGKVIGEFICDSIKPFDVPFPAYWDEVDQAALEAACLAYGEAHDYLGHKSGYAWQISDLVIYDTPKDVNEFWRLPCERMSDCGNCRKYDRANMACTRPPIITRPPQSWCYVEERE